MLAPAGAGNDEVITLASTTMRSAQAPTARIRNRLTAEYPHCSVGRRGDPCVSFWLRVSWRGYLICSDQGISRGGDVPGDKVLAKGPKCEGWPVRGVKKAISVAVALSQSVEEAVVGSQRG